MVNRAVTVLDTWIIKVPELFLTFTLHYINIYLVERLKGLADYVKFACVI